MNRDDLIAACTGLHPHVVPAYAGTHTPQRSLLDKTGNGYLVK
jgi:hypothetical protein